jgi:hypothetical protein
MHGGVFGLMGFLKSFLLFFLCEEMVPSWMMRAQGTELALWIWDVPPKARIWAAFIPLRE